MAKKIEINLDEITEFEEIRKVLRKRYPKRKNYEDKYQEIVDYFQQRGDYHWPRTQFEGNPEEHSPVQTVKLAFEDTKKYLKEMLK